MAYSAGFSPHPKISYANSAPTGVASEAEYVEIGVTVECDPDRMRTALDEALPQGLDVVEVVQARTSDFVQRLEASSWQFEVPGVSLGVLADCAEALLAAATIEVERLTKSGLRRFDARVAVVTMKISSTSRSTSWPIADSVNCGRSNSVISWTIPNKIKPLRISCVVETCWVSPRPNRRPCDAWSGPCSHAADLTVCWPPLSYVLWPPKVVGVHHSSRTGPRPDSTIP